MKKVFQNIIFYFFLLSISWILSCEDENPVNREDSEMPYKLAGQIVYEPRYPDNNLSAIYKVDLESDEPKPEILIERGYEHRVTPDGNSIIFTKIDYLQNIHKANIDGSDIQNLTNSDTSSCSFPDISPDGTRIVFDGCYNHSCPLSYSKYSYLLWAITILI